MGYFRLRYLVRFDDICPTMNWDNWERIEAVLNSLEVKPILAVVPDNRDPNLVAGPPREDFWGRVRQWQANGWTIAQHGFQHRYVTDDSGLVGINAYSEFAGLPYEEQLAKIQHGLEIMTRERVVADAWIAPAHSFDEQTLKAVLACGMAVVSDGFAFRPVVRSGLLWIPQQLWRFRRMPFGTWTVCFHPNNMSADDLDSCCRAVERYRHLIVSAPEVVATAGSATYGVLDLLMERLWRHKLVRRASNGSRRHLGTAPRRSSE